MEDEENSQGSGGQGDFTGAEGGKYKDPLPRMSLRTITGGIPHSFIDCVTPPVLHMSLHSYLPLGSPELDQIRGCGEHLDYGEGESEQQGML
jgi:hypothetical protein